MRGIVLAVALVAVAATGCIGTDGGDSLELSASGGSGGFVVAITATPDGTVERTSAWWAETGQSLNTSAYRAANAFRGVALKNDVALDTDAHVLTDGQRLVFLWASDDAGTMGRPGDTYDFFILERATDRVIASATLTITG